MGKLFFSFNQKNLTGKKGKNVHKSAIPMPACNTKFINRFFHSLLIFQNGKYQNQKIFSLSP